MNAKFLTALSIIPVLFLLASSLASAKNVALVVANANSLDPIFEQPLFDILTSMNETVTPVDQNSNANWNNFDLIVVAGRASTALPLPSSFAQSIPVNTIPTITVDYYNLYSWGWVKSGGANNMMSGSPQAALIVTNNHPITSGYTANQLIYVQNQSLLSNVDLTVGTSNFTNVANLDQAGDGGIAFASPNTILANGKSISGNSAAIFFGILYPAYWTTNTINIFENSVNWITNLNFVAPTVPTLTGPSTVLSSIATYIWTASSGPNGIQSYEIQIASSPDFKQIITDTQTLSLFYNLKGMLDGQRYYVRVRAIDFLNLQSPWSNTITTVSDSVPIILKIYSPASGSDLPVGQSASVNVSLVSTRLQSSVCSFYIDQNLVGTLPVNQSSMSCAGTIVIPQLTSGPTSTFFNASVSDIFGATNSTLVPITVSNRQTSGMTTTSTSTTSAPTSTGGSGGSYSYVILTVMSPNSLSYDISTQNSFQITVKNDGSETANAVKVTATTSNGVNVAITPTDVVDMNPGDTRNYTVTFFAPSTNQTFKIHIHTLSYQTTETDTSIPIQITEPAKIFNFGVTTIEIPNFIAQVPSLMNISVKNAGNVPGTANVNIAVPDGWTVASNTASVDLAPNQEMKLSFEVTPIASSGNITFSGTFTSNGQTKTFSYPTLVSANSNSNANPLALITAAVIDAFANPIIAVPTVLAAAVLFALYFKFKTVESFSKYVWPKGAKSSFGSVTPKSHQRNNFKVKNSSPSVATSQNHNSAYDKWENKFKRS